MPATKEHFVPPESRFSISPTPNKLKETFKKNKSNVLGLTKK